LESPHFRRFLSTRNSKHDEIKKASAAEDHPLHRTSHRHTLASAVVSYTIGQTSVEITTSLMESKARESNQMDRHNNRIGSDIGASAKSFHEIEPTVRQCISQGTVHSRAAEQITWLPPAKWSTGRLW
jgi:hypothetical protein